MSFLNDWLSGGLVFPIVVSTLIVLLWAGWKRLPDVDKPNSDIQSNNISVFANDELSRDSVLSLVPRDFEREVARVFCRLGYATHVTSQSGDGGKDIVAIKNGEMIFIECKQGGKKLEVKEIRAFAQVCRGAKAKHGIMLSVNGFTRPSLEEARRARPKIQCMDGEEFLRLRDGIEP
jgi:restriction endonuclease Mrr